MANNKMLICLFMACLTSLPCYSANQQIIGHIPSHTYAYQFTAGTTVNATVSWDSGSQLRLLFYNEGQDLLSSSGVGAGLDPSNPVTKIQDIFFDGRYFIRVHQQSGFSDYYTLEVSVDDILVGTHNDIILPLIVQKTFVDFTISEMAETELQYDGPIYNIAIFEPEADYLSGPAFVQNNELVNPKSLSFTPSLNGTWYFVITHSLTSTTDFPNFTLTVKGRGDGSGTEQSTSDCGLSFCSTCLNGTHCQKCLSSMYQNIKGQCCRIIDSCHSQHIVFVTSLSVFFSIVAAVIIYLIVRRSRNKFIKEQQKVAPAFPNQTEQNILDFDKESHFKELSLKDNELTVPVKLMTNENQRKKRKINPKINNDESLQILPRGRHRRKRREDPTLGEQKIENTQQRLQQDEGKVERSVSFPEDSEIFVPEDVAGNTRSKKVSQRRRKQGRKNASSNPKEESSFVYRQ